MTIKNLLVVLLTWLGGWSIVVAQTKSSPLDPAGYVLKYDSSFTGIGPKVYVLPAPRTKKEELTDIYREITPFRDSIHKAIRYQKLLSTLIPTSNALAVQYILQSTPSDTGHFDALLKKHLQANEHDIAYGILNEYAKFELLKKNKDAALAYLQQGLELATRLGKIADQTVFQANLATLHIIGRNARDAEKHEAAYYQTAVNDKNINNQAQSLIKQAIIHALDKDYSTAETIIIRKAIPLLNRSKHYAGKIWAWEMLADIYQAQNKHTEAQWFLIQARDLANTHQIEEELAEIEYMLAYSKYIQRNFNVAREEFKNAYDLASKEENQLLKLAIVEKLGNIYLMQNNIQFADDMLSEYWSLRTQLL